MPRIRQDAIRIIQRIPEDATLEDIVAALKANLRTEKRFPRHGVEDRGFGRRTEQYGRPEGERRSGFPRKARGEYPEKRRTGEFTNRPPRGNKTESRGEKRWESFSQSRGGEGFKKHSNGPRKQWSTESRGEESFGRRGTRPEGQRRRQETRGEKTTGSRPTTGGRRVVRSSKGPGKRY